jgi:hypothetical protein
LKFVGVVVFCLLSTSATAYQGVDLGRDCRGSNDAASARCEGFISGFVAGAQVDIEGEPANMWRYLGYTWCGPVVFDLPAIVEALFDISRTGQATPHFPAPVMLAQSLSVTYPCGGAAVSRFPSLSLSPIDSDK